MRQHFDMRCLQFLLDSGKEKAKVYELYRVLQNENWCQTWYSRADFETRLKVFGFTVEGIYYWL